MADQSKLELKGARSVDRDPTEHANEYPSTSKESDQAISDDDGDSPTHKVTRSYSSLPIPSVITGKQSTMMSKMVYLSNDDNQEPILAAEIHLGYSYKTPLGFIPGIMLYGGTNKKSRTIAAAGAKSLFDSRISSFSIASDIWLPRLVPTELCTALTPETMHAHTRKDCGVAFSFTIPVEKPRNKKFPRETFEWRKVKKRGGDKESIGGFDLLWLPAESQPETADVSNPIEGSSGLQNRQTAHADQEQTVASFSYRKKLSIDFTLQFKEDSLSGGMGDHWRLAVLITALRLQYLHLLGGTKKGMVSIGEVIRGK